MKKNTLSSLNLILLLIFLTSFSFCLINENEDIQEITQIPGLTYEENQDFHKSIIIVGKQIARKYGLILYIPIFPGEFDFQIGSYLLTEDSYMDENKGKQLLNSYLVDFKKELLQTASFKPIIMNNYSYEFVAYIENHCRETPKVNTLLKNMWMDQNEIVIQSMDCKKNIEIRRVEKMYP